MHGIELLHGFGDEGAGDEFAEAGFVDFEMLELVGLFAEALLEFDEVFAVPGEQADFASGMHDFAKCAQTKNSKSDANLL